MQRLLISGHQRFILLYPFTASLAPWTAGEVEACCGVTHPGSRTEQAWGGGSQGLLTSRRSLFPRVRIIPSGMCCLLSLQGRSHTGAFISFHSQERRGLGCSLKPGAGWAVEGLAWLGPAAAGVSPGLAQLLLSWQPVHESEPPQASLFLSRPAATAPDSRQSRKESCGSKTRCPSPRSKLRDPFPSSER